ncbi:MAG TPA: hypothetical protein VGM83_19895 [Devosiaceae bacterium]|jgi:hypothetical protein
MTWPFDQARNVACLSSRAVIAGAPPLVVTHYEDDHSWAFLAGEEASEPVVVAMSRVIDLYPELLQLADLPPGWTATRDAADRPWHRRRSA